MGTCCPASVYFTHSGWLKFKILEILSSPFVLIRNKEIKRDNHILVKRLEKIFDQRVISRRRREIVVHNHLFETGGKKEGSPPRHLLWKFLANTSGLGEWMTQEEEEEWTKCFSFYYSPTGGFLLEQKERRREQLAFASVFVCVLFWVNSWIHGGKTNYFILYKIKFLLQETTNFFSFYLRQKKMLLL